MDPLSLTASIIAILGAARAGIHGLKKLQILYKAPQVVGDLLGELKDFQGLVEEIMEILEIVVPNEHAQCASQLKSLVERGGDIVSEINGVLASPPFQSFRLKNANQVRAIWLRNSGRLNALHQALKHVRVKLMDTLGVLTA